MRKVQSIVGFDFKNREYEYVPEFYDKFFSESTLTKFRESFAEFIPIYLSKTAANIIEKLVNMKQIYYMGIKNDDILLAGLIIFKLDDEPINNFELISSYIRNASIILEKMTAEKLALENSWMLSNIINSLPLSVFWKDAKGRYLGGNKNFGGFIGVDDISEIIGKTDENPLIHGDNSDFYMEEDRRILETQESIYGIVHKLETADITQWISVNKTLLKDYDGNVFGILGIFEEITERLLIENKLKENEERLRLALQVTNDIVWDWDVIQNNIIFNELGKKYFGEQNIEKREDMPWWLSNIYPDDKENIENYFRESLNNPKIENIHYEYRYAKENGSLLHIVDRAIILRDIDGRAYRLVGAMRDVTEERRIANELRDREQEFRLYLENAFDGFFAMKNRKFTYANKRILELVGFSYEEVVNKNFDVNTLIADKFKSFVDNKMKAREQGNHGLDQYEIEIVGKDGKKRIIELSTASLDRANEYYAIGVVRDITYKKQSELKIKEEANLRKLVFGLALNFINAPLSIISDEIVSSLKMIGEYVGADRAYIFEYDFEKEICSNTYEWCAEGVSSHIEETQGLSMDINIESFKRHLQGKEHFVADIADLEEDIFKELLAHQDVKSLVSVPMMSDGKPIGFVGFDYTKELHTELNEQEHSLLLLFSKILVNIHLRIANELELILLKEKADESNRLKSSFLANMSHEIRTPINGIIGSINILKEPDLSEEERDEYYDYLRTSGNRLINTIEDIVKISLIDSGQFELSYSDINLLELLNNCIDQYFINAKQKEIAIRFDYDDEIINIHSDRDKLTEIINLLLDNAIKFTEKGYVELSYKVDKKNSLILIYIKDTGMGIPKDKYYQIFERFIQLHTDLSRPYEGSGLGLSIAKAYAIILGGDISIDSIEGIGSTFCISLPIPK